MAKILFCKTPSGKRYIPQAEYNALIEKGVKVEVIERKDM